MRKDAGEYYKSAAETYRNRIEDIKAEIAKLQADVMQREQFGKTHPDHHINWASAGDLGRIRQQLRVINGQE